LRHVSAAVTTTIRNTIPSGKCDTTSSLLTGPPIEYVCVHDRTDCLKRAVLLLLLLLRGTVCPDGGDCRHRNMSECSLTVEVLLNGYMCIALGQCVDNNWRDTYIVKCIVTQFTGRRNLPEIFSEPQILHHTVTVPPLAGGQGLS
jgi:hypothetical protein